jgi:DNA-binding MarR family transcriptional regulator
MTKKPFGFESAHDSPGFLLWQTTMSWQRLIKKTLEPSKISHAQFVILAILLWFELHKEVLTQVKIANWSKLDKMTVSKSLKQLVQQGYVIRVESEVDTRAKNVHLTESGRTLTHALVPKVEQVDAEFFSALKKEQQKNLIEIFRKLST